MEILFNEEIARSYDQWAETPRGRRAYELEGELLLRLGRLAPGQKILEVGCGTGAHLGIFLREGLEVFGLDVSPFMLRKARSRLGNEIPLCLGDAGRLPFKDGSFETVMLITTLEFLSSPAEALREAIRCSRERVVLGVLNGFSFLGAARTLKGKLRRGIYNRARFYTIWELRRLVAEAAPGARVDWASVLVLPVSCQSRFPELERWLSFRRNPLGAFLGLAISAREV